MQALLEVQELAQNTVFAKLKDGFSSFMFDHLEASGIDLEDALYGTLDVVGFVGKYLGRCYAPEVQSDTVEALAASVQDCVDTWAIVSAHVASEEIHGQARKTCEDAYLLFGPTLMETALQVCYSLGENYCVPLDELLRCINEL